MAEEEILFEGQMADVNTKEDGQETNNVMKAAANDGGNVDDVGGDQVFEPVTSDGQTTEEETPSRQEVSSGDLAPEDEGSMVIVEEGEIPENGAINEQTTREGINQETERSEESHDEGFEEIATATTEEGNLAGSNGNLGKDGITPGADGGESQEGSVVKVNDGTVEQSDDFGKSMDTSMEIIEMNEAKDEDEVISLETLPTSDDAKVKDIQTQLQETILLLQVIKTLALVGKYLRITTNATADDASLLINQQGSLFETLKLCDTLSLMMQSFQSGANNILEKLKIAYLYLLDGFPDFAMTDIAAIAKDVDTMKTAVGKTQKKVTEMRKKVKEMKSQVEKALEKRQSKLESAEKELAELMSGGSSETDPQSPKTTQICVFDRSIQCVLRTAVAVSVFVGLGITRKLRLLEILRYMTSIKVVVWILQKGIDVVTVFPNCSLRSNCLDVLKWFKEGIPEEVPSNESVTHAILGEDNASLRQRSVGMTQKVTEMRNKVQEAPSNIEAGAKMSPTTSKAAFEVAMEISSLKDDIQKYKEVVHRVKLVLTIIEQTDPLLDSVESILLTSTDLVQKWYKECADIVEPSMALTVKAAEKLGEEEKMKYWKSIQFQQEVVTYYCRWRALQVYCETNRSHLRQVRKAVEEYYTENMLPRDAVKFSWELASRESDPSIQAICGQHQDDQELRGDAGSFVSQVGLVRASAPF
ncbi:uncharacterized protein LOC135498063 [Lineus longissimus]|uniref:uncharacterized protein LOC135498063 n=1 Tax=Lineus longissimus TaxID=88925 RepID=UPI002B4DCA35